VHWPEKQNTNQNKDKWVINSCLRLKDRIWKLVWLHVVEGGFPHLSRESKDKISIFSGQVDMNLYHIF